MKSFVNDVKKILDILRESRMRLNPEKCVFGVQSGKFLGYLISLKGIEVNPDKIQAIQEMEAPKTIKDVQRLTGRLAALNRFLSKFAQRKLHFFRALKKSEAFEWTSKCQDSFEQLKEHLKKIPTLTSAEVGKTLYMYLAVAEETIIADLVKEKLGVQYPIYYVSKVLNGPESRYSLTEKLALCLVNAARRLKLGVRIGR